MDLNMCRSSPCLNGGTCDNLPNAFVCNCTAGFTGPTCNDVIIETPSVDIETSSAFIYIGLGVGIALIVIFLIAVILIITVCMKRKKPEEPYCEFHRYKSLFVC